MAVRDLPHLARRGRTCQGSAMPERSRTPRQPRDPNQLAKLVADIATGEAQERPSSLEGKDAAAVSLGRRGGLKGGRKRAEALTAERRREIAQQAAASRWKKHDR